METARILLVVLLVTLCYTSSAQEGKLKESIYGLQFGLFGVVIYNEARLTDELVFRSQIEPLYLFRRKGLYQDIFGFISVLGVQSKWYYNLNNRLKKGKNILNNGVNFVSLNAKYISDKFVIITDPYFQKISNSIVIYQAWGFRRNFSKNFNYESSIKSKIFVKIKAEGIFNPQLTYC